MFNLFRKKVITRIAPSPTGVMHIGTARAALFNYLFARQNKGKFILRIEDTDKERSKKEFEEDILKSLEWLELDYDEIYHQSERTEVYKKYLNQMIESGAAYISKETEGDRDSVIRFKNSNKEVVFDDLIRGEIKFNTTELGDFVIAKSKDEPLYHLAVVVDDYEMGVTHVIRGEDGISNTPRQILIQEAIGAKRPIYAHLPLVLGKDKSKLSKRHGATSLTEFKNKGYLKEAIINQLAFLGWNPGDEREIFTLKELIREFDIKKVSKGGAVFNEEKLDWFNKEYIKKLPRKEIEKEIEKRLVKFNPPQDKIEKITEIIMDRIFRFNEIDEMIKAGEFDYYFNDPEYLVEKIIWKEGSVEETIIHLKKMKELILNLSENINSEDIKNVLWDYATKNGKGQVLWPLRYSLSGADKSPDPFQLIWVLGKEISIRRIDNTINKLNEF